MDERWQRALDAYLTQIHARCGSKDSFYAYRLQLKLFFQDHPDPEAVKPFDVQVWCYRPTVNAGTQPKPGTIHSRHAPILGFYRRCVSWGLIAVSPAELMELPKINPAPARYLTPTEVQRLIEAIPVALNGAREADRREARDRAMILTAYHTSLRAAEVCRITPECLSGSWDSPSGDVYASVKVKGGGVRQVHLPPPVVEAIRLAVALRGYRLDQAPRQEAVWGPMDRSLFGRQVRIYGQVAGLGSIGPHLLRHGLAKWMDEQNAPLGAIQLQLGHLSRATTDTYVKRQGRPKPSQMWRKLDEAMKAG